MIDLHSHILYGIDDGSQSLDMSLEMLRLSAVSGVTDIFATPHVNRRGVIPPWDTITSKVQNLQKQADAAGIDIRIHMGAEVEMNSDMLPFLSENSREYCLAGSRYILTEFTEQSQPDQAESLLYELMLRGFVPILAHPERYERIMAHPERVLEWMNQGILAQCTAGSFTGAFGRNAQNAAEQMLERNLVIFLGSDAHRVEFRNTDMRAGQRAIAAIDKGQHTWETCIANAEHVLRDTVLYPNIPEHWHAKKRGFFTRFFT